MATGLVWHEQYMRHDAGRWAGYTPPGCAAAAMMGGQELASHQEAAIAGADALLQHVR